MTFHIDGNLTASEAVRTYEQLQVHPDIEKWAEAYDALVEIGGLEGLDELKEASESCGNKNGEVDNAIIRIERSEKAYPYTKLELLEILNSIKKL